MQLTDEGRRVLALPTATCSARRPAERDAHLQFVALRSGARCHVAAAMQPGCEPRALSVVKMSGSLKSQVNLRAVHGFGQERLRGHIEEPCQFQHIHDVRRRLTTVVAVELGLRWRHQWRLLYEQVMDLLRREISWSATKIGRAHIPLTDQLTKASSEMPDCRM